MVEGVNESGAALPRQRNSRPLHFGFRQVDRRRLRHGFWDVIQACRTAMEDCAVVHGDTYRHLMFIHFSQMECFKLIASTGFPEKRIDYLKLMLLLDELRY